MIYFSLAIFLFCGWFAPWWSLGIAALVLGLVLRGNSAWRNSLQTSVAAGLAWAALAYVMDGRSHGIISVRMSGLFGLPSPFLIFLVLAVLAALTALLCFNAGAAIRGFVSPDQSAERKI